MRHYYLLLFTFVLFVLSLTSCAEKQKLIQYVDPMIGTDAHTHTFPGATTPFGMVQVSPSNDFKSWDWCSGYHYSDSILKGFAHTHISGAGLAGLGDILLMPTSGATKLKDGTEKDPDSGFRSRFSHDREVASAGYYSVVLDDYDIKAELTCTPRVGFHKYTYKRAGKGNIIIDPTHHIAENLYASGLEFLSDTEMRGYKHSNGEFGNRKVYFYAKCSKKFKKKGVAINDLIIPDQNSASDRKVKGFVSFDVKAGEQVEVKVAISHVSYEGAKANFNAEAEKLSFDEALVAAQEVWEEKLNKFEIQTKSLSEKRTFYTAVYRTMISPNRISDVTGEYRVEGKKYHSDYEQYSNFSTWDTYRATHPLMAIVEQDKTVDFVNSLVSRHTVSKVGLPFWEGLGHDNFCMIGYNTVPVITDAIMKEIPGIDVESAYDAMRSASFSLEKNSNAYGANGMKYYIDMNFIPSKVGCSVSKTTEYNYFDWCISEVAGKLAKLDDVSLFRERATGYRNLFDEKSGYLLPLAQNGKLLDLDRTKWDGLITNYVSGNIWGYSTYVPHDMGYLMNLHGGKKNFSEWLDTIFADDSEMGGSQHVDISGFIGKYGHGDEPSHQMTYLYDFAGQPWKTQKLVREILPKFYQDHPAGLNNNDDLGQMAAWYIFSSMGFYPVCPGSNQYQIGSPAYTKATINLENGSAFTVIANNNSKDNVYIQSAKLNGKTFSKPFLSYNQIKNGGELVFEMGNKPNKEWGSKENDIADMVGVKPTNTYPLHKEKQVLMPFNGDETFIFENQKTIAVKCNTIDAEIRYTTDGSEPTLKSKLYTNAFTIRKNTTLNAKAFKSGLKESNTFEVSYFKGIQYNSKAGYPKVSLAKETSGYGEASGKQLFDGQFGTLIFNDGSWTGIDSHDLEATIDLGRQRTIREVTTGFLVNTGNWIFNPESIEVLVSSDNKSFKSVRKVKTNTPGETARYIERTPLSFNPTLSRYVKVKFKNKLVPSWHVGGGNNRNHWIFVDEIVID